MSTHSFVRALLLVPLLVVARPAGAQQTPDTQHSPGEPAARATEAQSKEGPARPPDEIARQARELTARGARFLLAAQEKEGGWNGEMGPGITCLVLKALIEEPSIGPQHEAVRRGMEFVLRAQRDDGGIYGAEGLLKNYESSVALSMFASLERAERTAKSADAARIAKLREFLKKHQWDEDDGKSVDDPWYGGAGYGHGKRPDLSNTQMMLEALHDSGLPKDDPAYKKAVSFISRCQMLAEHNDQPFARGATDGGFIYSPANAGESKAGEVEAAGGKALRCYGSMTYAGFKSLLYAGLERSDPRVKAALEWIRRHWTLEFNPNMPEAQSREGLYYYYHVFARAMSAWGEREIEDARGEKHDWRRELVARLAKLQRSDGSWVNADEERWMEGNPSLATAYSMLALHAVVGAD